MRTWVKCIFMHFNLNLKLLLHHTYLAAIAYTSYSANFSFTLKTYGYVIKIYIFNTDLTALQFVKYIEPKH